MEFNVVIGSWGAYNSDNEKALGSDWIDFAKYNSWEEIEEELKKQGFDIEGEDEELFIQDLDFEMPDDMNCDSTHPKFLFDILKNSEALIREWSYYEMLAYCEVESWKDFCELVEKRKNNWDSNISFTQDAKGWEWAYDEIKGWFSDKDIWMFKSLESYIDFDGYFDETGAHETSYGVILIDNN